MAGSLPSTYSIGWLKSAASRLKSDSGEESCDHSHHPTLLAPSHGGLDDEHDDDLGLDDEHDDDLGLDDELQYGFGLFQNMYLVSFCDFVCECKCGRNQLE